MGNFIHKWIKYVELESLMQTKIDLSAINESQFIPIEINPNSEKSEIIFAPTDKTISLIKEKIFSRDSQSNKKVVLSYPFVTFKQKNKEFLRPLFIFEINFDISAIEETKRIKIDAFSNNMFMPVVEVFEQDFKIDKDFFSENISFLRQINKFLNDEEQDINKAIELFIQNIRQMLDQKSTIEIRYDYCFVHEIENGFLTKKTKDALTVLSGANTQSSLLEKYINQRDDGVFDESIYDKSTYYGKFPNQKPLSLGQHRAIKSIHYGEKLIAVQGGPGTGKTTLFLNVIASIITERAIAITSGKDFNNQMVVTSIANKAIDNVINEFKMADFLKDHYDFFLYIGNNEQINVSLDRIQNFIDTIDSSVFDEALYKQLINKIIETKKQIDSYLQKITKTKQDYKTYLQQKDKQQENITEWQARLSNLKKIFNLNLDDIKIEVNRAAVFFENLKRFCEKINSSANIGDFDWKKILQMEKDLEETINKINSVPVYNIELLFHSRERIFNKFLKKYIEILDFLEIDKTLLTYIKSEILEQKINILIKNYLEILKHSNIDDIFLNNYDLIDTVINDLNYEQKWRDARSWFNQYKDIESEFNKINRDDLEIERFDLVDKQEELFLLSLDLLRLEQIKKKQSVKIALNHFRNILTNNQSRRSSKIIYESGVLNFFKELSLVYPVISTTIASSWMLTKDFIYNFELNDGGEKTIDYIAGFKPFHYLLSDESGMTKVHEPASLLYASDAAMVVGDPKQLPPIFNISANVAENFEIEHFQDMREAEMLSPTSASFYHRAAGCRRTMFEDIGRCIILNEHRRCQPKIAKLFIEIGGYSGIEIKTEKMSEEDQNKINIFSNNENIVICDVVGQKYKNQNNTNIDEVNAIDKILTKLELSGYDIKNDVGIITPYIAQRELLIHNFADKINHKKGSQKIGTIHAFQGAEYKVVIFSSVLHSQNDSGSFLNSAPNLLNVAVSRAKHLFIIVCNKEKLINSGGTLAKIINKGEIIDV